jgi:ADP-heptose:LPS heptosyltransferase
VIHHGALGDWVLVFPLLRALPGTTLAVAAGEKARLAARLIPSVEAMDINARDFTLLHAKGGWREVKTLSRERYAQLDGWVVSFVSDGGDTWAENAARLMPRARFVFAQPRLPVGWRRHATRWHAEQSARQGLSLPVVKVERRANPHGPVVIHPGSGGAAKCWPRERFEAVILALLDRGIPVQPIFGEVEWETWPAADRARWEARWDAVHVRTLDELATRLAAARLFIGNDSGPTHLAAQLGIPTLALFGPTSPGVWGPVGPACSVLVSEGPGREIEALAVETVLAAIHRELDRPSPS